MESWSSNTSEEWRQALSSEIRAMRAMVRRMDVKLHAGALWQVAGHTSPEGQRETAEVEVFGTLGFYSRPRNGANAEAMIVHPAGAASNPIAVATRDEGLRASLPELPPDSAMMANRVAIVFAKPDGTVEVRAIGGTAVPLATKADLDALAAVMASHKHPFVAKAGPDALVTAITDTTVPSAAGTTVLRGQ